MTIIHRAIIGTAIAWVAGYSCIMLWPAIEPVWWYGLLPPILLLWMKWLTLPGKQWIWYLFIILVAMNYYHWFDSTNRSNIPAVLAEEEVYVKGMIETPVSIDGDQVAMIVRIGELIQQDGTKIHAKGESVRLTIRLLHRDEQQQAEGWGRGDKIQLIGTLRLPQEASNFDSFDYRRYLYLQHIHWQLQMKGLDTIQVWSNHNWNLNHILRFNDQLRDWLSGRLDQLFPPLHAGYMKGLLIGERSELDPQAFAQFSQLGLTHILAISGLHVGIFMMMIMGTLSRIGFVRERIQSVTIAIIPIYILITGSSPSVIRAGMMAMIGLYLVRRKQVKQSLTIVMAVGILMLIWSPYYLLDVGFQLSFLVTIGLIVGVSRIQSILPNRLGKLRGPIAIAVTAQFMSFPLTIYYFSQFSMLSLFANLVFVPIISMVIIPLGYAVLFVGSVLGNLGELLAWPVTYLNEWIFYAVNWLVQWEAWQMIWPRPERWWVLAYYIGISWLLHSWINWQLGRSRLKEGIRIEAPRISLQWLCSFVFSLTVTIGLLLYGYAPDRWDRTGRIQLLDVGQGDAIAIRTSEGKHVLIDGGGTVTFRKPGEEWKERRDPYEVGKKLIVPLLKQRGVQQLDAVLITHFDADHYGGLQAVVEEIPIRKILFNGSVKRNAGVVRLLQTAMEKEIDLVAASEGMELKISNSTSITFLAPPSSDENEGNIIEEDAQNDRSLVAMLTMHEHQFLFTGDMEKDAEYEWLSKAELLGQLNEDEKKAPIAFMKVAHHGSKTSSTAAWLDYWQPQAVGISLGRNNIYRHPSPEVIDRLEERRIPIYRTDLLGEIQIIVKRESIQYRSVFQLGERQ